MGVVVGWYRVALRWGGGGVGGGQVDGRRLGRGGEGGVSAGCVGGEGGVGLVWCGGGVIVWCWLEVGEMCWWGGLSLLGVLIVH